MLMFTTVPALAAQMAEIPSSRITGFLTELIIILGCFFVVTVLSYLSLLAY